MLITAALFLSSFLYWSPPPWASRPSFFLLFLSSLYPSVFLSVAEIPFNKMHSSAVLRHCLCMRLFICTHLSPLVYRSVIIEYNRACHETLLANKDIILLCRWAKLLMFSITEVKLVIGATARYVIQSRGCWIVCDDCLCYNCSLKLGKILGEGAFGIVLKGVVKGIDRDRKAETLVAVKTIKRMLFPLYFCYIKVRILKRYSRYLYRCK